MSIKVTSQALDEIRQSGAAADPLEACGLLLGSQQDGVNAITLAVETRNAHPTPLTNFEIEPQAMIDAYREERNGGPCLMGYFHSHPTGKPEPSLVDQTQSPRDGRIWAIVSGNEVRFWKDQPDGFAPLDHEVFDAVRSTP